MLEDLILDALKVRLMAPELVTEFIAEYHAEINRQLHAAELDAGFDPRELKEVARKLAGLIEAVADSLRAPGLQECLDELEQRKEALTAKIAAAPRRRPGCIPTSPSCIVKRWRNCGRR